MVMSLKELSSKLQQRLLRPLPGGDAHEFFRAHPVGDVRPLFDHRLPPKPGGVLILLYEHGSQIRFPLIKRNEYVGAHSGQVSLPGGKTEPGEDSVQAALRECEEELGLDRMSVSVVGTLSEFFVMPSNYMVTPVVAYSEARPVYRPDPIEVCRVLEMDLDSIVRDDAIRQKEILVAEKYRMIAPHFEIDGEVVWGATAMMLNEFRMIVREMM